MVNSKVAPLRAKNDVWLCPPLSNFANKLPTTPERRYSGRYGLELFKTVRLAFIGSIVVEISYEKVPQGDFFRKS